MKGKYIRQILICSILALFFFTGCATVRTPQIVERPQIINVKEKLTIHLYDSLSALRAAYMYKGGKTGKINKVLGFYSDKNNSLHCLKWDFETCGHELFHALQYKGSPTLTADKGYEHFKENNYAREYK